MVPENNHAFFRLSFRDTTKNCIFPFIKITGTMIIDKIENASLYSSIHPLIAEGLKFITENDFSTIDPCKFQLKDDLLYAMVNEYETKPASACKPEAHKKYSDIQFMVSGVEKIGFTTYTGQQPSEAYNIEKDVQFFQVATDVFSLKAGYFAIFFPNDIHQPCIMNDSPSTVKKVVVKVAVR
jgi:YhcH/YjgK/YiaL family protein